jgi:hypothetical protein
LQGKLFQAGIVRTSLARILLCVGLTVTGATLSAGGEAAPPVFDASHLHQSTELGSVWLVHEGDDSAYAQPGFDDTRWARFDPNTDVKLLFPKGRPEVVWYRLHIRLGAGQTGVALLEHNLSSAFEIYVNGRKLLQNGQVAPYHPNTYSARILVPVPDAMAATGSLTIALRVHISAAEWDTPGPGYAAENLMFGPEEGLREHLWLALIGSDGPICAILFFGFCIGIAALALYTAQRDRLEYLWIFLQSLFVVGGIPLSVLLLTRNVSARWGLVTLLLNTGSVLFEILIFLRLLHRPFGRVARILTALALLGVALAEFLQIGGENTQGASLLVQLPLLVMAALALPALAILELRRGNREAGLLLIPILLSSLTIYIQIVAFVLLRIPWLAGPTARWVTALFAFHAGPFVIGLGQLDIFLYFLSLGLIIVLRSTRMSRQQAILDGELAAAREVQQVILPEQVEAIPGYTVETVYQPAQQVGGDFFQVIPAAGGGLLLILGDVAGKGLPAAMLVSVLVGAVRTAVRYTQAPAAILVELNERLIGRTRGAFSTAMAAHFAADGTVTIANAGHLSPYLDGREIELPVALPLGILSGAFYPATQFQLEPGSRLTFYSDGVVEAQNAGGELLGFERAQELSTRPAAAIVEAAKRFGHSDDITVVAITRSAAATAAA